MGGGNEDGWAGVDCGFNVAEQESIFYEREGELK
jgi:hypothetical protein